MTEFRGARGSNTGDDFHELWATRQAIRLLLNDDGFVALTVEGLAASDEASASEDTWDGVDCTLYYGGASAVDANDVVLEQLKYSAASPGTPWTVARLIAGKRREQSVIARLAKAWKGLMALRQGQSTPTPMLISNQPVDPEVIDAFARASTAPIRLPKSKPKTSAVPELKLAYATGLDSAQFKEFSTAIRFEGGAGSRFALEERVLRTIADWTDHDVQHVATGLRQFIRNRMRPEFAGDLITRESIMIQLGASERLALFPCQSEIAKTEGIVSRAPVRKAVDLLLSGTQYLCLHGKGGVGKTTALQELESSLPAGSVMITYDCYGGGRYMDPSAFRHRPVDAFVQLTNELAARLKLPLLLNRHLGSDYPRLFANRLRHAASVVAAQQSDALVVIAVDAADNAVTAAKTRAPIDPCFVHDFVLLSDIPTNVRFVVTARTGRLDELRLSSSYVLNEIEPFNRSETGENVTRIWPAPESWIDDFHDLSSGVPRIQAYAFKVDGAHPSTAIDRLRPAGKSLDEVFRQQFSEALTKSGNRTEVQKLCAGLVSLPRPVPMPALAAVLSCTEAMLTDVCMDLAPGIRLHDGLVSFADEDFEHFVRNEGISQLSDVQQNAASWLLSNAGVDRYSAIGVAAALVSAGRGSELLNLVEQEPAPLAVTDPVLRREVEVQRLRLAIKVCRDAGDVPRALRFVLIGAEGIKTEAALRDLLVSNPDMAANFAQETAGRLILSDPQHIEEHGSLLFHKLSVDANRNDVASVREGKRLLRAWLQARHDNRFGEDGNRHSKVWKISTADIASQVEAALKVSGPEAALESLDRWSPKSIAVEVGTTLPPRLIAEGHADAVEMIIAKQLVGPIGQLFLHIPLALSGHPTNSELIAAGLQALYRRKLRVRKYFADYHDGPSVHWLILDLTLTACELLTGERADKILVDKVLDDYLVPELRRIDCRHTFEAPKLDLIFRAHALREARLGRIPTTENIFEPRPESENEEDRRSVSRSIESHDRPLMDLVNAVFPVYAAVAQALVTQKTEEELTGLFSAAIGRLKGSEWRISRQHGATALRVRAATSALVVFARGYRSLAVKEFACEVHGNWGGGYPPDSDVVARLSLREELHPVLLCELVAGAGKARKMRVGASEKSSALVSYARLTAPISKPDANSIFNYAVEAASELDQEILAQIRFLDRVILRGGSTYSDARLTARRLSDVIADAAIRLDGYDHFPWDESMSALARLDTALALANAARWDDETVATLDDSLPPLLRTALLHGNLSPSQFSALLLFLGDEQDLLLDVLRSATTLKSPVLPQLAEEMAKDFLVRYGGHRNEQLSFFIDQQSFEGNWTGALRRQDRFLSSLKSVAPVTPKERKLRAKLDDTLAGYIWDRETLTDSTRLRSAIESLRERGDEDHLYLSVGDIVKSSRSAVHPRDRIAYLSVLAEINDLSITNDAVKALLETVKEWWDSPAVKEWCRNSLPDIIGARFHEFARYLSYGEDDLSLALEKAGITESEAQDLVLRGIERHVDSFGAETLFALAALIGSRLTPLESAGLADWYVQRLADRIPSEDRDQTTSGNDLPIDVSESVARFLFAYMGDFDLRMRWRAAHAVRRLARLGDNATLVSLIGQYERRNEEEFRGRTLAFYWLAARMWFVIALDRVAEERPVIAAVAGKRLLDIALDETFPHVLVRSFARDACEKLSSAGLLVIAVEESSRLLQVNESQLPRCASRKRARQHMVRDDERRRFSFDTMDTIPYWYEPLLNTFSTLDGERLLQEAERWIIDVWGYDGDLRSFDKERRRGRFQDRQWMLTSNRHGSTPTLERLNTHLEWHAMWCAVGELLKSEPLIPRDDDNWDAWYDLTARISREKLSEPPLWAADLLGPVPLIARNWQSDEAPLVDWVSGVVEMDHRSEIFAEDKPGYLVVEGHAERRWSDRIETTNVSSSLVDPISGGSLIRALQTMEDSWDYALPSEGGDNEVDRTPFRLIGWLRSSGRETRCDETDPLRGYASVIAEYPGKRVIEACGLRWDKSKGARWVGLNDEEPMFIFEVWGKEASDHERYERERVGVSGRRLLVHKTQLQEYLRSQNLDLVIESEVTRRAREDGRYASEEETKIPEGRFDRLYRLQRDGSLEIAEGCIGAWSGDSS